MFEIKTTFALNRKTIYDLIITGLECGSMASFEVLDSKVYKAAWEEQDAGGLSPVADCFKNVGLLDRCADGPLSIDDCVFLTDVVLQKGLNALQEKAPRHITAVIQDHADALTGDSFLQCCVLGEIVYG